MTPPDNPWDRAYLAHPPWDIGRPQRAFADLAAAGELTGTVLEMGCGTGANVLAAAVRGATAIGVDISYRAIDLARAKAARRGVAVRFEVADVLDPDAVARAVRDASSGSAGGRPVDVLIDSGTFHVFDAAGRARYAAGAAGVLKPGGRAFLLCAVADPSRVWGPAGLGRADVAAAFADGWTVESMRDAEFELGPGAPVPSMPAWLVMLVRAA